MNGNEATPCLQVVSGVRFTPIFQTYSGLIISYTCTAAQIVNMRTIPNSLSCLQADIHVHTKLSLCYAFNDDNHMGKSCVPYC